MSNAQYGVHVNGIWLCGIGEGGLVRSREKESATPLWLRLGLGCLMIEHATG